MKAIPITKEFVQEHLAELIYLNRDQVDERMHWTKSNFLADFDKKWEISIAAIENNKILGYIFGSNKDECAHVNLLMVGTQYRSRRVGNYLLRQFQSHATIRNYNKMSLWVYGDLTSVQYFYEKFGFVKKRIRINDKGENLSKFEKELIKL
jgi:ribosomal protein S18 acetylase RimI-like enzyme